jgi:outer membrane protein OmpA-like peptidoglycan-associated protein
LHEDVPPGNYTLELTLEFFEGPAAVVDKYQSPLVVLPSGDSLPQVRLIGAVPRVVMARLGGLLFETNKNFLLPNSLPALSDLVQVYRENPSAKLLVVGHTDTVGDPGYNDPLSFERAEGVAAYLKDNVDHWLGRYELGVTWATRSWSAKSTRSF